MKKSILFLLFLFFSFTGSAQILSSKKLKTGDFIFQNKNCGPLCDAINAVTEGYKGNDFNHIGIVYIKNDTIYIIEAAGTEVRLVSLDKFSESVTTAMYIGRVKKRYKRLIPKAISFSLQQLGVPYDDEYVYNNGKYYCSELIYDAFLSANGNTPFFKLYPMTYKQPNTNTYFPAWANYYKEIGKEIPQGLPGCNPGGLSVSNKINIIGTLER